MSVIQWLEKKQHVMDPVEWGGDMEVRLLTIELYWSLLPALMVVMLESFPASLPLCPR